MSGWDQEYDLQDWAREVQQQAEQLQKTNKAARWMYLIPAVFLIALGFFVGNAFLITIGSLFAILFAWNERMIRKLKKAGIK